MDDSDDNDADLVRLKIADLEIRVQDQADEISSLKGSLSELLKRVTQLENQTHTDSIPTNFNFHRSSSSASLRSAGSDSPRRSNMNSIHRTPAKPIVNGKQLPSYTSIPSPRPISRSRQISPINRPMSMSVSNLAKMKKFTGYQDMGSTNSLANRSMFCGSMLNLHTRSTPPVPHLKHGTKETTFNSDEGTVKMYLRGRPIVMHVPTEHLKDYTIRKLGSGPSARMKLEWVYGYRGRDCRSNLFLLPTGEIVYFVASVVVLHSVEDQIQRHYVEHTDDVKCLTVHPNKLLIATGQVGGITRKNFSAHVRVWDSVSLHTLHIIGAGEFDRSVYCVAFSKMDGGALLCVIDESSEHTIRLWEWQKGEAGVKLAEAKNTPETVLAVEFHPMERHTLVTIGKGHVHFWDTEGWTLAKKLGLFDKHDKPKFILCMTFTDTGDLLTGDSNGKIMIWNKGSNRVSRVIYDAHDGGVFSICPMKDGTVLTGGGKDRRIVEWDSSIVQTGNEAVIPEQAGGLRVLIQGKGNTVMVGTVKNSILQGTMSLGFRSILQGHTDEIRVLAVHPVQSQFLSGGHDRYIHLWDTMSHSIVWSKEMMEAIHSGCISPDGIVIIVATITGQWIVLDAATKEIFSTHSDGTEAIDCIKFSPDGKYLAIGSRDNHIYIYQVSDNGQRYNRIGRCTGHSSFVTQMDWSDDSNYIQTTSGDYELLYWNASVCRQINNMSIARDIKWSTQTCTLGFTVFGVWPENADGSDVNSCDKSHNGKFCVTGDDWGKVNLYAYPACQPKCLHYSYGGHSSQVTSVAFLPDDTRVISVGAADCAIMQWMLT